jgi:Skp family chaperone for outer membrane proteins
MHLIKRTVRVPALALVLALGAAFAYQAIGQRTGSASPTVVVTVNLGAVLEGLEQRSVAEAEIKELGDRSQAEDQRRQKEIEDLRTQLENLPEADEEARDAVREQIARVALQYQAWGRFALEQLDMEKSLRYRDLDRSIKSAIAQLCEIEGYDIVLMDDSQQELTVSRDSRVSREVQVLQQMTSRRIVYVNPVADITDELIERMNNAYSAGG